MDASVVLLVIMALVLIVAVVGWVARRGVSRFDGEGEPELEQSKIDLELLPEGVLPGRRATIVLFTAPDSPECAVTRWMLQDVAATSAGVVLAEVDTSIRPELVLPYDIVVTPTVLLLDADGNRVGRFDGAPLRESVEAQLIELSVR